MNTFIPLIILNYIAGKDMISSKTDFNANSLLTTGLTRFSIFLFDNSSSDVCRKRVQSCRIHQHGRNLLGYCVTMKLEYKMWV